MNRCFFTGNAANQPELKGQNNHVLVFRLAVNGRAYNQETETWEDRADFIDCVMYGKRAEAVGAWLKKGQQVTIEAHARQNTWTTDAGENRSKIEFVVDDLVAAPKK